MRFFRLLALVMVVLAPACTSSLVVAPAEVTDAQIIAAAPTPEPTPEPEPVTPEPELDPVEPDAVDSEAGATEAAPEESSTELVSEGSENDDSASAIEEEETPEATPEPVFEPRATGFAVRECYAGQIWEERPRPVACYASHIAEVVVVGELGVGPEVTFPGNERLKIMVSDACAREYRSATIELQEFVETIPSRIWPDEAQWANGDRSYVCAAAFHSPVTLSLSALHLAIPEPTPSPSANGGRLQLGLCYTEPALNVYPYVPVACSTPHYGEVFHIGDFSDPAGTPNPGRDALHRRASQACGQVFAQKFGVPLAESVFQSYTFSPTPGWDRGDRRFICLAVYDDMLSSPLSAVNPLTYGPQDSFYGMRTGTCVNGNLFDGDREIVDCSAPHNLQVISTAALDTSVAYPGRDAVSARSSNICDQASQSVNSSKVSSILTIWPSERSWQRGDGVVLCFAKHRTSVTTSLFG